MSNLGTTGTQVKFFYNLIMNHFIAIVSGGSELELVILAVQVISCTEF